MAGGMLIPYDFLYPVLAMGDVFVRPQFGWVCIYGGSDA